MATLHYDFHQIMFLICWLFGYLLVSLWYVLSTDQVPVGSML